jgi:hypothetical protein
MASRGSVEPEAMEHLDCLPLRIRGSRTEAVPTIECIETPVPVRIALILSGHDLEELRSFPGSKRWRG